MHVRTEDELVERARGGDTLAYAELVTRHREMAFRVAHVITRSAADAEEAAQDGFVKAWRALDRFREGSPFRPWLLRIVSNEARNRVRSRRRREALAVRASELTARQHASAEDEAVAIAQRKALAAAVDDLPERHRRVISCLYFLGLSEQETAEVLGVARGTVKSRAARARVALEKQLGGLR